MVDKRSQTPRGFLTWLKNVFRAGPSTIGPKEAAKLRAKYTHFRVLVIGRANAGKTTILRRVCNTTEDPVYGELRPTNERGIHNVWDEFSFESNPQFIFHDSPGFEAGGEEELLEVQAFIHEKAKSKEVMDQIHVIWFCFTPDASRPLLELEKRFFNEQRAGNVPVVAIFTKFDDLIVQVYDDENDKEGNRLLACATLEEKFEQPLKSYAFPPCAFVCFESIHRDKGNHQEQIGELMRQTAESMDNLTLRMLFVTVQQNNLELCIEYAVENMREFKYITDVGDLVWEAATWFGHCYKTHDYGKQEEQEMQQERMMFMMRKEFGGMRRAQMLERFVSQISSIVNVNYQKPSVYALAAILISLEHSFWPTHNGSNPATGFKTAWYLYMRSHQANVDEQLKKHLKSKGSGNWFRPYGPTQADTDVFIKIILGNRISHLDPSTSL